MALWFIIYEPSPIIAIVYGVSLLSYTVFDLITASALINPPLTFYFIIAHLSIFFLTFYFIFTYYRPLDDLFLDFSLYFYLLSPTWRSFGTSSREQIYVSAPGAY